jgi:CDP-paratose 2-epimerase
VLARQILTRRALFLHLPAVFVYTWIVRKARVMVTGSCGLIGSEVCLHFYQSGYSVLGIDNNQRAVFFGPEGDTSWTLDRLRQNIPGYEHHDIDIRDRAEIIRLVERTRPAVIVHTAAQPSHDRAAQIAFDDFDTNAVGTLNLLEAARRWAPESPFIHMSTNKVYGDRPNKLALVEKETRWDYADPEYRLGIPESFSIDQSLHSLFGASKVASDVMVQEYGRYFGMPTCALRGGCLTGPNHSGVELHGFLSYLIRCNLTGKEYKIFGYKGKQVRDNIHSEDVARFMLAFAQKPRCGEVYNLGGGFENSCSILEAFALAAEVSGREQAWTYVESNRIGDHICYYSDLTKMKAHYPDWGITKSLRQTVAEISASWCSRLMDAQ